MTRDALDKKLDEVERIERQVRRYDGAATANQMTYGGVDWRTLANSDLTAEEIASAALSGITNELRPGNIPLAMRRLHAEWVDEAGDPMFFSKDGTKHGWYNRRFRNHWPYDGGCLATGKAKLRPLGISWADLEAKVAAAGGAS